MSTRWRLMLHGWWQWWVLQTHAGIFWWSLEWHVANITGDDQGSNDTPLLRYQAVLRNWHQQNCAQPLVIHLLQLFTAQMPPSWRWMLLCNFFLLSLATAFILNNEKNISRWPWSSQKKWDIHIKEVFCKIYFHQNYSYLERKTLNIFLKTGPVRTAGHLDYRAHVHVGHPTAAMQSYFLVGQAPGHRHYFKQWSW